MTDIIKQVEKILFDAGIEEYKAEAKLIAKEISGLSLEDILLKKPIKNENEIIKIANQRAKTKAPIQHILGYGYFMGEKYVINKDVLIPRDETEILVEKSYEIIENNFSKSDKINILDIGTGSGCISCALAKKLKNYDIEIIAIDINIKSLQIAIENISKLDLVRKVVVRKSDIFSKIRDIEKFDLIISNPPYIPVKSKNTLQKEVLFDPEIALFAHDEEGIEFYEKIIKEAPKFLKEKGFLAFELGINQSMLVKNLFEKDFFNIEITKDLANIDRVISAKFKQN